eukprot:364586-Chlamydomonas_euryale.AAC.9
MQQAQAERHSPVCQRTAPISAAQRAVNFCGWNRALCRASTRVEQLPETCSRDRARISPWAWAWDLCVEA